MSNGMDIQSLILNWSLGPNQDKCLTSAAANSQPKDVALYGFLWHFLVDLLLADQVTCVMYEWG